MKRKTKFESKEDEKVYSVIKTGFSMCKKEKYFHVIHWILDGN